MYARIRMRLVCNPSLQDFYKRHRINNAIIDDDACICMHLVCNPSLQDFTKDMATSTPLPLTQLIGTPLNTAR
jgi:hypothetical protein